MGNRVGRSDQGWETSVALVKLTAKGQELFGKDLLVCVTHTARLLRSTAC